MSKLLLPSGRRALGISLLEAMIVSVLFLLAMGMIATLFHFGTRATRSGGARADQSMERLDVASRLRRAMLTSYQSGNSAFYQAADTDSLVLCLISSLTVDGEKSWDSDRQAPLFHAYEVFYRNPNDQTLRWRRIETSPSEVARPLTLAEIQPNLSPADLVLARSVSSFQLYSVEDSTVRTGLANPLGVRLVLSTGRNTPLTTEVTFKFAAQ